MNSLIISGYLSKDPEVRTFSDGSKKVTLTIPDERSYKDSEGNWQKKTQWLRVGVWGKLGENCAKYLAKDKYVSVAGELEINDYEVEGQKKQSIECRASKVDFGPKRELRSQPSEPVERQELRLPRAPADFSQNSPSLDDIPF